jgi:transposase
MQDRQLYEKILGIEKPWSIERVELKKEEEEVHVYLVHRREWLWECPKCREECRLYDHQPERQWRHLDTCQFETILHAEMPRSNCREHGALAVKLPWAEPMSHFTALFEAVAIDWLREASQEAVARRMRLTWEEIHGIMERAVKRGLLRRKAETVIHLGVDEKAFRKGHRYLTIVNDLNRAKVLYVAPERKQTSLDGFWPTLTGEQRDSIEAVAMDMWRPYMNSTAENLTDGASKIVFDKFHIVGHLGKAVDKVRRGEQKILKKEGDNRLKGTKYDWLRNPENFKKDDWLEFKKLKDSDLQTARAWALKESAMHLFKSSSEDAAKSHFRRWYFWATHSRLKPMIDVARSLKGHLPNILTYIKHKITNAMSESLNSKIQWVKYTARGFRNQSNFINAIYFHCGGLDLAPLST